MEPGPERQIIKQEAIAYNLWKHGLLEDDAAFQEILADAARWRKVEDRVNTIRETEWGIAITMHLPIKRVNKSGSFRLAEAIDRLIEEETK